MNDFLTTRLHKIFTRFFLFLVLISCNPVVSFFLLGTPSSFISNPASLDIPIETTYRIRYLLIDAGFSNNSLNMIEINKHFVKDPNWDNIQKTDVFNTIPNSGLSANLDASITPVEFSTHLFTASFFYRELVTGKAGKDILDLALFGNDLDRKYCVDNTEFNRLGYYDFSLGSSYPIINPALHKKVMVTTQPFNDNKKKGADTKSASRIPIREKGRFDRRINIGARFHWQKGRFVTLTDSAYGMVMTTTDSLLAQLKLFQTTANGGNGFALDLGASAQLHFNLTIGLALLNLNTGFNWTTRPKSRTVEITIDSFSHINNFYRKFDSTKSIAGFKTSLPPQILLQASYQPIKLVKISTNYYHSIRENRFIGDFTRSLNFDFYLSPLPAFATSISFTTDLKKNIKIGQGLHFIIKNFNFNIFANQRNGYLGSAKGIDLCFDFAQSW